MAAWPLACTSKASYFLIDIKWYFSKFGVWVGFIHLNFPPSPVKQSEMKTRIPAILHWCNVTLAPLSSPQLSACRRWASAVRWARCARRWCACRWSTWRGSRRWPRGASTVWAPTSSGGARWRAPCTAAASEPTRPPENSCRRRWSNTTGRISRMGVLLFPPTPHSQRAPCCSFRQRSSATRRPSSTRWRCLCRSTSPCPLLSRYR